MFSDALLFILIDRKLFHATVKRCKVVISDLWGFYLNSCTLCPIEKQSHLWIWGTITPFQVNRLFIKLLTTLRMNCMVFEGGDKD